MILGIAVAVVVVGGGFLAGVFALAKAFDYFNKLTEGDEDNEEIKTN